MPKIDLKKQLKHLYGVTKRDPVLVDVPTMNFLLVDGVGNPNTAQAYTDAAQALYSVSYTLKFMLKKHGSKPDFVVMPLEGLWWTDDMADFSADNKDIWKWTMMVMQPDWITRAHFNEAREQAAKKKALPALENLRFEPFEAGTAAHCLHIGPYVDEAPTIQKLHQFISDQGMSLRGKHHEIYLSDPRRAAPEKLKTIIRQPAEKA